MFLTAVRLLSIKDLKALSFFCRHFSIDMQVLKDLKRCFHKGVLSKNRAGVSLAMFQSTTGLRGTGPRATGPERVFL